MGHSVAGPSARSPSPGHRKASAQATRGRPPAREIYAKQRIPGDYTASPWSYRGRVFCINEDGDTTVIGADDTFKILGRNLLGELCLATPALAGNDLILRTAGHLYCFRESAGPALEKLDDEWGE